MSDRGEDGRPGVVVVATAMCCRLTRYTIPGILRRHRVGLMVGLGYGVISVAVVAGAVQTAIHASHPGVSLAGELAWHIGVAVAVLVGFAGLFAGVIWVAVTQYELAEAKRRRIAQERGLEEPLALWRVPRPASTRQWWRRPHRRHPHHAHRRRDRA